MNSLLQHEVKYYFNNRQEAIYLYSYFSSVLVLLPFSMKMSSAALQALAPAGLWIALASATALGGSSLFKRDFDQGRLEYYQLLPIPLEAVVFFKWFAFFLFLLVPLAAAIPVAGLLFGLPMASLGKYAVGLGAGAVALSIITSLVAAITNGMDKAGAVVSLLILPLAIPVTIFGSDYCRNSGGIWQSNLLFLIGFSLFLLPVLCFAGASSIRHSN